MTMKKTFDAGKAEERIYSQWEAAGAFAAGANAGPGADSFCIMIPPPNVTGVLHMGHAFNNTVQDILIRWNRLRGFDVLWQPGQDHAGIATQMVVERELGETGQLTRIELGREAFLDQVWAWKEEKGGKIINQLKRLGASCDWTRNRFTLDQGFHDAVIKVFVELYRKGHIYRGKRLVNWDPHFETAISDLEVEQVEVDGKMWRLRYRLENGESYQHPVEFDEEGKPVSWETRDYLVVATTRPETMLGDTGVAVHPEDDRYRHLVGKTVCLPLALRSIPIIADRHADPAKGTGAVKITPAHDFNDWLVSQRTGLRAVNVMTTRAEMALAGNLEFLKGCSDPSAALALDGMDRYAARFRIVELAEEQGWLDGVDDDRHTVPHGDRSKVAIEPFLTEQWFVDARELVGPAIDAVRDGRTRILPEQFAKVYFNWLENIEPWCISRQLWWGHQIPVWYDSEGNEYCAESEDEAMRMAGGRQLSRDPDVLDTWFSSGLWPIGTLGWPQDTPELRRYFPTDVLVTGFDIIFFWVARMMMIQLAVVNEVPFHTVYVHALVRDKHGKKMAKSVGNVIDPIKLIDEYGADAVRFTLASMAAMGRDLRLAESRVAGYRNFATKVWNAARFAELNRCSPVEGFNPSGVKEPVNQWIIGETARARENLDEALEAYRFNDASSGLYAFVWGKVCDWYLEFAKPLLNSGNNEAVAETRATLAWVLENCLVFLHPFMPFITEELWSGTGERTRMLALADWPKLNSDSLAIAEADKEIGWIIRLIEEIRSIRSHFRVPAGSRPSLMPTEVDEFGSVALSRSRELVERLARVHLSEGTGLGEPNSATISVDENVLILSLADHVNVAEERARLKTSLEKAKRDVAVLHKRLSNENFLAKAGEHVVEDTRDRARQKEAEADALDRALGMLEPSP